MARRCRASRRSNISRCSRCCCCRRRQTRYCNQLSRVYSVLVTRVVDNDYGPMCIDSGFFSRGERSHSFLPSCREPSIYSISFSFPRFSFSLFPSHRESKRSVSSRISVSSSKEAGYVGILEILIS